MRLLAAFILTLSFLLHSLNAFANNTKPIGVIKNTTGIVEIIRSEASISAKVGTDIYLNDLVKTQGDGTVGFSLDDGTTISLGEESELLINDFVYEPASKEVSLGMNMLQGSLLYLSGKIANISPDDVSVTTPVMTNGIRGTKFLLKVDKP